MWESAPKEAGRSGTVHLHDAPEISITPQRIGVTLVSPLPPPVGGLSTWTRIVAELGLPEPFTLHIVDTRVTRKHQYSATSLGLEEFKRNFRILRGIHRSLTSEASSLMHLNCSLYFLGSFRNFAASYIARRVKKPYVAHLRGLFTVPPSTGLGSSIQGQIYRWLYRRIFDGAEAVLVEGASSHRSVLELGNYGSKTRNLPNFVDSSSLPITMPRTARSRRRQVVFVGSLVKSKGAFTVVDVAKRMPDTRFHLVGHAPDPSRINLADYIRRQQVEDQVTVSGPFPNDEVLSIISQADVFFLPSFREGFPISVAEAMAVGLPVVASPVGAIPEMIDVPEGGVLVPPGDVQGYVDALSSLFDNPQKLVQMGQHNRTKALREYDYNVVIQRICDVYRSIVGISDSAGRYRG